MSEEKKWVTPTDGMERRVAFHILIRDKHYAVYDIPKAYHSLGTANGEPFEDTYFILYANEWVPFISKGVHRICWEIKYKQTNTAKNKWDEWRFSNSGHCEMWANGILIYEFFGRTLDYSLSKAQYLTVALLEFPGFNFLHPEENEGKKVWWLGLPAIIQLSKIRPWEISIHPDLTEIPKEKWWSLYKERTTNVNNTDTESKEEEKEDFEEDNSSGYINWGDAFEAGGRINWFRK